MNPIFFLGVKQEIFLNSSTGEVEVFDTYGENGWLSGGPFPVAAMDLTSTATVGNTIYVFGKTKKITSEKSIQNWKIF